MTFAHRRQFGSFGQLCRNFLSISTLFFIVLAQPRAPLVETERVVEYHNRNYTWPLQNYRPDHEGWKQLMESRFRQVEEVSESGPRYTGFMQTLHSAFLVPNFTEHGFGLARCPDRLLKTLQEGVHDGLASKHGPSDEGRIDIIKGPHSPWFIRRPDLTRRVLTDLQHYAEAWSGLELYPHRAYGFRLYRNESTLMMHVDRMQTHIISFILHVDSSDDAEPWPIAIEDYHGRTHEVILTPGDILFYESSKCFHGRPRPFRGSWYTSVFVHYFPLDGWSDQDHKLEAHYAVPPHWVNDPVGERKYEKLEMIGTSFSEPNCVNTWCRTKDSVKWGGPGEEGYWIDPTGQKHEFRPEKVLTGKSNDDEL